MRRSKLLLAFALLTSGCAAAPPLAPQPLKPIDPARFFTGRWYEIARTPMIFTNGCVAGTTDFFETDRAQLIERDECREGSPEGKVKIFQGPVDVLNPGENTKFTVHYALYGLLPLSQTYWVLDHAPDYAWFIVSNPSFQNIALLGRTPRPAPGEAAVLTQEARAMGYDTSKLEFPTPFPPSMK
jgi:apolipoprotein D and lipocalin family protein